MVPPELHDLLVRQLTPGKSRLSYNLKFHALDFKDKVKIHEDEVLEVHSFPLKHKIPTCGFLIKEKPKLLKINKEKIKGKKIKIEHFRDLQNGLDIKLDSGEVYRYQDFTLSPSPELSYAYCSDTKKNNEIPEYIMGATALYHEATFLIKDKDRAKTTLHSTTEDAAKTAVLAKVKKLFVGHISSRYTSDEIHQEEVQRIFENAEVAHDGMIIDLSKI